MKFLLGLLLTLSFSTSAFADCHYAYSKAGRNRDIRNQVLVVTAAFVSGSLIFLPVAAAVQSIGYTGYYVGLLIGPELVNESENNFYDVRNAITAAHKKQKSKALDNLTKKVAKAQKADVTPELESKVAALLVQGDADETFCPVVKVKKNGKEKYAVFTKSAMVKYLVENL